MRSIAILGSTGSIGTQTLQVVEANPTLFQVELLTAQNNWELLVQQALRVQPNAVVIGNKKRGLSRFESLLKGLGLADRLVFNKDEALMVAGRPINWDNVQERLNYLRDKSYCFLKTSLRYSK